MAGMMFDLPQEDLQARASERAMRYAQMAPEQRTVYNQQIANSNLVNAGEGMLRAGLGAATGTDTRTDQQRMQAAKAEMAQRTQGVTDQVQMLQIAIQVLQKYGFPEQAMALAKQAEDTGNKRRDDERATKKDEAANEIAKRKVAVLERGSKEQQMLETLGKLYKQLETTEPGTPEYTSLKNRIRLGEETLAKSNIQVKDAGGFLQVFVNGEPVTAVQKTIDPNEQLKADASGKKGALVGDKLLDEWGNIVGTLRQYNALSSQFKPEYADRNIIAQFSNATGFDAFYQKAKALTAQTPQERAAAAWWQQLAEQIMQVRHDIFGATLTAGESAAFDAVRPVIGQSPEVVLQRLQALSAAGSNKLRSRIETVGSGGKDVSGPLRMLAGVGGVAAPTAPAGRTAMQPGAQSTAPVADAPGKFKSNW